MKNVPIMDATAFNVLKRFASYCKKHQIRMMFCEVNTQPMRLMERNGFVEKNGADRFFERFEDALSTAQQMLAPKKSKSKKSALSYSI